MGDPEGVDEDASSDNEPLSSLDVENFDKTDDDFWTVG